MSMDDVIANLRRLADRPEILRVRVAEEIHSCKPSELRTLAKRLSKTAELSRLAIGIAFPRTFLDIGDWSSLPHLQPERTCFTWAAAVLRLFSSEIGLFLEYEARFDAATFAGEWRNASQVLDEVEEHLGLSLWLLNQRLVVLERLEGVDEQKRFLAKLQSSDVSTGTVRLVASVMSMQAELTLSADSYYDQIEQNFAGTEDRFLLEFIAFNGAFFGPFQFSKIVDIVGIMASSSIIDRYLAFIRVGQLIYADSQLSRYGKPFRKGLELFGTPVSDSRLAWLAAVFDVSAEPLRSSFSHEYTAVFDLYTRGQYETALREIERLTQSKPAAAELIELHAKCIARTRALRTDGAGVEPPVACRALVTLLLSEESTASAIGPLKKEIACFSHSKRAALLHACLLRLTSPSTEMLPVKFARFSELCGPVSNPRALFHAGKASPRIRDVSSVLLAGSPTYALFAMGGKNKLSAALAKAARQIPKPRIEKYLGAYAAQIGAHDTALAHFVELEHTGDPLDQIDGREGAVAALLHLRRLSEASQLLCRAIALAPTTQTRLPIENLCDALELDQHNLPTERMPIEIPNVFGNYSAFRRKDREYRMGTVCEDFLASWNLKKPHELESVAETFAVPQLIFFLSRVCVLSALECHPCYDDYKELEDERVAILLWLMRLDERDRVTYAEEIAEITRNQKIRSAMRSVEQSKVNVNVAGVLSVLPAESEEAFVRFCSLPRFSKSELEELLRKVAALRQVQRAGESSERVVVVVSQGERSKALLRFYDLIKQKFVFSNDFGLDAYLSVGIRHHTLVGQLRACFEKEQLVTGRTESGEYASNSFWLEKYRTRWEPPDVIERIDQALRSFSKSVDASIAYLRNSLIQVRSEKHVDGLFSFALDDATAASLEAQLLSGISYRQAVDRVIELLWEQTDAGLKAVQMTLDGDFRRQLETALDNLATSVHEATSNRLSALDAAITSAGTAIHDEIAKVSAWFTRGSASTVDDFEFSLAADIAVAMANRCNASRKLLVTYKTEGSARLRPATLNGLVNMLFILFDNALKHSPQNTVNRPEFSGGSNL
jgi:tetratricopeptide (TPR) repeat protein